MGIFNAFKKASQTIEDAKRDVKPKGKDEVAEKRDQKRGGKK